MMTESEIREFLKGKDGQKKETVVKKVSFQPLAPPNQKEQLHIEVNYLDNIYTDITAELGHTTLKIKEILNLAEGSLIELERPAGDTVDVLVNQQRFARGEVVIIGVNFGIRIDRIYESEKTKTG